jgi:lipid-binding SYLF domain-containing protein
MRSKIINALLLSIAIAALGVHGFAQNKDKNKGKELKAAVDRVDKASDVIDEVMKVAEKSIPRDLLKKAKAIVVFPGTLKAAFIVGGQGGTGVAIRRTESGWSAPAFLNMAGGSFGAQIGGQKTDYVLLIMNDKGISNLLQDKFEIGGEGSVSAGPVGRTAAASTNVTLDAEILSYSRSKGLFAGIALKGVVISQDQDMNQAVYEKSAAQILGSTPLPSSEAPATLRKFSETVADYVK